MSQKIHPIGLRVGLHRKWNNSWFETQKHYTQILHESFLLEKLLKSLLNYNFHKKALLINCKFIKHSYDSLIIIVFFYRYRYKKNFTKKYY
jgi:ribosomal protein S3